MLIGRLGKDPDVRYLENNVGVARFTLATSETYKDTNGDKVEKTEWHNIVVWRGLAEVAKNYLKKGSLIFVEGKLSSRSYEVQGEKKYFTEVVASDFRMLDRKDANTQGTTQAEDNKVSEPGPDEMEDDLPF
jgi:single-strand DNA-binding protein